jgi:hypothetical protein
MERILRLSIILNLLLIITLILKISSNHITGISIINPRIHASLKSSHILKYTALDNYPLKKSNFTKKKTDKIDKIIIYFLKCEKFKSFITVLLRILTYVSSHGEYSKYSWIIIGHATPNHLDSDRAQQPHKTQTPTNLLETKCKTCIMRR